MNEEEGFVHQYYEGFTVRFVYTSCVADLS